MEERRKNFSFIESLGPVRTNIACHKPHGLTASTHHQNLLESTT